MNKYIILTILTVIIFSTPVYFWLYNKRATSDPIPMYSEGTIENPEDPFLYTYCKCDGQQKIDKNSGRPINFSGLCYGELYDCKAYQHEIIWE